MSDTEDELYRQLAEQPLVNLTGVVSASGAGGGMSPGDTLWTFVFSLAAWRVDDGDINRFELIVRKSVTEDEMDALFARLQANTIVKLRARVALENVFGRPEALLEELIGEDGSDVELNDFLAEFLKPVVHNDGYFGDFTLDRSATTFVTQKMWNGAPVELRLWLDKIDEFDEALKHARDFWASCRKWDKRILDCIARDCLSLKNEIWQEDDGSIVSRDQFEARIALQSITIRPDGDFDVSYNDGNLFFGHDIVAMGNLGKDDLSAGIHG
jgi:hypothetical protein